MMKPIWILSVLVLVACSDRPSREKFPGPQGRTTDTSSAEMTQAMLGGFDPLNNPFAGGGPAKAQNPPAEAGAAPGVASASAAGGAVEGTVSLGSGVQARPGMWLFISVRSKMGGPPLAAKREAAPKFPYSFRLSQADAMMADTKFEGDVEVTARLDQDGDPLSRQPGDASGSVAVTVPAKALKLELKTNK